MIILKNILIFFSCWIKKEPYKSQRIKHYRGYLVKMNLGRLKIEEQFLDYQSLSFIKFNKKDFSDQKNYALYETSFQPSIHREPERKRNKLNRKSSYENVEVV